MIMLGMVLAVTHITGSSVWARFTATGSRIHHVVPDHILYRWEGKMLVQLSCYKRLAFSADNRPPTNQKAGINPIIDRVDGGGGQ